MERDDGIKLGSMLFTLVEPHQGHEVAYNRWYERDHFYAGCLIGPWLFAGRRWVAPRDLKIERYPAEPPMFGDPKLGSYVAVYWVLEGKHDEHFSWALDQVKWLHANGRMFPERDHIHTLLYRYRWWVGRDDDGVPPELALDHPFQGMAAVMVERNEGVGFADVDHWYQERLKGVMAGTPAALCLSFTPIPLPGDAPVTQPGMENLDRRTLQLWFLDESPREGGWDVLRREGEAIADAGLGRVAWAAPFLPTMVGTDRYTDELW